jgi:hypothetical protein
MPLAVPSLQGNPIQQFDCWLDECAKEKPTILLTTMIAITALAMLISTIIFASLTTTSTVITICVGINFLATSALTWIFVKTYLEQSLLAQEKAKQQD